MGTEYTRPGCMIPKDPYDDSTEDDTLKSGGNSICWVLTVPQPSCGAQELSCTDMGLLETCITRRLGIRHVFATQTSAMALEGRKLEEGGSTVELTDWLRLPLLCL